MNLPAVITTLILRLKIQLTDRDRDERGESNITTQLGMIVLGIVLLVTIFGLLNTFAGDVITSIRKSLNL